MTEKRCCDVPLAHIPFVWPHVEPLLAKSLKYDDCGAYWPVDVFEILLRGEPFRLWVAYDEERREFDGCAVTEIIQYPRVRQCRVWLVGGRNLRLWWKELCQMLEAYAKSEKCGFITGAGRKGWARMPGWQVSGVLVGKALSDG